MVSTLNLAETLLTLPKKTLFATQLMIEACILIPPEKTLFFQKKIRQSALVLNTIVQCQKKVMKLIAGGKILF